MKIMLKCVTTNLVPASNVFRAFKLLHSLEPGLRSEDWLVLSPADCGQADQEESKDGLHLGYRLLLDK